MNLRDVKKIRAAIVAGEPDGSYNRNLTRSISRNIDNIFVDIEAYAGFNLDKELFLDTELVTSPEKIKSQLDQSLYNIHKRVQKIQQTPIVEEVMNRVKEIDSIQIKKGQQKNNDSISYESRGGENAPTFQKGERITFSSNKVTLTGEIVRSDAATVTITCDGREMTTDRRMGQYVKVPPLETEQTKEFAQEKAKQLMGTGSKISFAQTSGVYKGEIIGMTPSYAIQKVNREAAVLHRLKDLAQANYAAAPIQEGSNVTITKEGAWLSITLCDRELEEKSRGQERQKGRDGQSR